MSSQIDWLKQKSDWAGIKTIAMIEESQQVGDKISVERRFFISSLPADAQKIAGAVRAHWLVENALHWTLDVVFGEDKSRKHKGNEGENFSFIRRMALNILNHITEINEALDVEEK